jgi:hypothetical protein
MPQTQRNKVPEKTAKSAGTEAPRAEPPPKSADANEGEGNRTAARRYNRATEEYARSGRVEPAAKAAEKALEGPERAELERAEEAGKAKASDIEREADREGLDAEREAPEERDEDA